MAQRPTRMQVVFWEFGCPDGKKNSSMALKRAKRTQQWKLLMRTLLKGIDSLLKTWTQAVSYSRFRQCRTPNTKPTVWTLVQDSFLPSKQKRGRMRMGPKYSIQNTIYHLICLPKFLTVRVLVGSLAILSGIQLSERTCLVSPSLQESSCCRTGTLVCFLISSLIHLMVHVQSATMASCLSLQLTVRFNVISSISTKYISIFISPSYKVYASPTCQMAKKINELFDVSKLSEASLRKYQSYFQIDANKEQLKDKVKSHFNAQLQVDLVHDLDAFLELKREERGYRKRIARSTRLPGSEYE